MKTKELPKEYQADLHEIGRKLKELRKANGLSYIEIAKKIGIARNSYNQLELGSSNFEFITLLAVLKYHGIGLREFFKD